MRAGARLLVDAALGGGGKANGLRVAVDIDRVLLFMRLPRQMTT